MCLQNQPASALALEEPHPMCWDYMLLNTVGYLPGVTVPSSAILDAPESNVSNVVLIWDVVWVGFFVCYVLNRQRFVAPPFSL